MKPLQEIASRLQVDEQLAREFCAAVQKLCPKAVPPYSLIATALRTLPTSSQTPEAVAGYCRSHVPTKRRPKRRPKRRGKTRLERPVPRPKAAPEIQRARAISYLAATLRRQGHSTLSPEDFYERVLDRTRNILQRPSHIPWAARSLEKEDILATPVSVANRLRDLYARRTPTAREVSVPMGGSPSGRSRGG